MTWIKDYKGKEECVVKEYKTPVCELIALDEEDIITTSGGAGCQGDAEGGGDCQMGMS